MIHHYKITVAFVAALVTLPTYAQSSVTVYGLVDLGISKVSNAPVGLNRGYLNWLGITGTEDLGSGLSANFNLMTRFLTDTGQSESSTFWHGESTVGLKHVDYGQLRLGRAMTPLFGTKYKFEPWGDSWMNGSLGKFQTGGSFFSDPSMCVTDCAGFARVNNGVFYETPVINGFQLQTSAQVEMAPGTTARNGSVSLNYAKGPLSTMLAYERNTNRDRAALAAASYDFGSLTAIGSVGYHKIYGYTSGMSTVLALTYDFSERQRIRAGFGRIFDTKEKKLSTGYIYSFSKRTSVYADIFAEKLVQNANGNGTAIGIQHTF